MPLTQALVRVGLVVIVLLVDAVVSEVHVFVGQTLHSLRVPAIFILPSLFYFLFVCLFV